MKNKPKFGIYTSIFILYIAYIMNTFSTSKNIFFKWTPIIYSHKCRSIMCGYYIDTNYTKWQIRRNSIENYNMLSLCYELTLMDNHKRNIICRWDLWSICCNYKNVIHGYMQVLCHWHSGTTSLYCRFWTAKQPKQNTDYSCVHKLYSKSIKSFKSVLLYSNLRGWNYISNRQTKGTCEYLILYYNLVLLKVFKSWACAFSL